MKSTITKSLLLALACAFSLSSSAQGYGVTDEASRQNTPSGWPTVALPQLPEITSANTITLTAADLSATGDNTDAIQAALDKVPSDGGMVVLPAGTWLFGAGESYQQLTLKSKTILYLSAGCTLKLQPYGTALNNKTHFITCVKKTTTSDIVIQGEDKETSVLDGDGWNWWAAKENGDTFNPGSMVRFEQGQRFLIKNITVKNAPGVNLTISNSGKASDATIHDVIISEPASDLGTGLSSHNTDGISIWGPRVNIYDCTISNGDDNVVVDDNGQYIHVWNCAFGTGHGASLGSYTKNVHDVLYEDITMDGTDSGCRLKSQRGRSGSVYNITWKNITMKNVDNPVYIETWYDLSTKPVPSEATAADSTDTTPYFHDILIQNVTSTGTPYKSSAKNNFPVYIYGLPESYVSNVTLDNVQIEAQKGMFLAFVRGLTFKNGCKITNSRTSGKLIETQYEADITGDYQGNGGSEDPGQPSQTYTLDATTCTSTSGDASPWTFSGGFTITNESGKTYAVGQSGTNTIKYGKGNQFTVHIPDGISIASVTFTGYGNDDSTDAYLEEVNGTKYDATTYTFPNKTTGGTATHTITFDAAVTDSFTFKTKGAQGCFIIQLTTSGTSGISQTYTLDPSNNSAVYNLAGQRVCDNYKGVVIKNGKKYVQR